VKTRLQVVVVVVVVVVLVAAVVVVVVVAYFCIVSYELIFLPHGVFGWFSRKKSRVIVFTYPGFS
jgi:hypothetical protein